MFSFIKALPALWPLAQLGVYTLGIARAAARYLAELTFADGIADANVHERILMRIGISSKKNNEGANLW